MPGDYTRLTFDPLLDRAMVLEQQGKVHLDADFNELASIVERRFRVETRDLVGPAVYPAIEPDSFRIQFSSGGYTIGRGRMYVDGLLAENHGSGPLETEPVWDEPRRANATPFNAQPYAGTQPTPPTIAGGRTLLYLDVFQRELTHVEDPSMLEPALGVDTTTRIQTAWQVKALPLGDSDITCADDWSGFDPWLAATRRSDARLTSDANKPPEPSDPCAVAPIGGYRGLENRLYRVEIHDGGGAGSATVKWSRDNGAVATRITAITGATTVPVLTVERLGRDEVLRFAAGDWVELLDDRLELDGSPGVMARVLETDPTQSTVTLDAALPSATPLDLARNPRLRRWDQESTAADGGVIPITAFPQTVALEDGVEVTIDLADPGGAAKTGDWWVFSARAVTGDVEHLEAAPPRGVRHHYARLAIVSGDDVSDCRVPWPGDCDCEPGEPTECECDDCGCDACVTPESHGLDDGPLTIQAAIEQVKAKGGGRVCLSAGVYVLRRPIVIDGAVSLTVVGVGAKTIIVGALPVGILVRDSAEVTLERFSLMVRRGRGTSGALPDIGDAPIEAHEDIGAAPAPVAAPAPAPGASGVPMPPPGEAVIDDERPDPERLASMHAGSTAAAPAGMTVGIALVNTVDSRVERTFVVVPSEGGASVGIGLGGFAARTRLLENVVLADVAIGDLTPGRSTSMVKAHGSYQQVRLVNQSQASAGYAQFVGRTQYLISVDLAIDDNMLLGRRCGIDFGSATVDGNLEVQGGLTVLALTRAERNLVIGGEEAGIALHGTSFGELTASLFAAAGGAVGGSDVKGTGNALLALAGGAGPRVVGNVLVVKGDGILALLDGGRFDDNAVYGSDAIDLEQPLRMGISVGEGIELTEPASARVTGNVVEGFSGGGVRVFGVISDATVTGNAIARCGVFGVAAADRSAQRDERSVAAVQLDDNVVERIAGLEDAGAVGVGAIGLATVSASGNLLRSIGVDRDHPVQTDEGGAGIGIDGCEAVTVSANQLVDAEGAEVWNELDGISVRGVGRSLVVSANTIEVGPQRPRGSFAVEVVGGKLEGERQDGALPPLPDALVSANVLRGPGSDDGESAVVVLTEVDATFSDNRTHWLAPKRQSPVVVVRTEGAVVLSGNRTVGPVDRERSAIRVDCGSSPSGDPAATAVGNISCGRIEINGVPPVPPFDALNIEA